MRLNSKKVRKLSSFFTAILSFCGGIKHVIMLTCVCLIAFPATLLICLILGIGDLCDLYMSFLKARK